jgi:hypothetical protein
VQPQKSARYREQDDYRDEIGICVSVFHFSLFHFSLELGEAFTRRSF